MNEQAPTHVDIQGTPIEAGAKVAYFAGGRYDSLNIARVLEVRTKVKVEVVKSSRGLSSSTPLPTTWTDAERLVVLEAARGGAVPAGVPAAAQERSAAIAQAVQAAVDELVAGPRRVVMLQSEPGVGAVAAAGVAVRNRFGDQAVLELSGSGIGSLHERIESAEFGTGTDVVVIDQVEQMGASDVEALIDLIAGEPFLRMRKYRAEGSSSLPFTAKLVLVSTGDASHVAHLRGFAMHVVELP